MGLTTLSSAGRFEAIIAPLKPAFDQLEGFLGRQIGAFEPEVRPLVEYCLSHSGKKLRPILVFTMAREEAASLPDEATIKAAAIVELVHLATLVHDDILDDAGLRHRTETVFARYGSHVAVLLGDALFAHALHLASGFPDVQVCRTISMATRQVCSGEIAQTFSRGTRIPDEAAYLRMIDLKTAELFAASAFLGAYLSAFDKPALEAAGDFARNLGIAYQIYDDAADIFGREAQAGKTLGTDFATGKYTLPILYWLDGMDAADRESTEKGLCNGDFDHAEIRKHLSQDRIADRVGSAFNARIRMAKEQIGRIPGTYRRESLGQIADFVDSAWNKFSIR